MALNLKQLEAFVAVADLGSFRRAAEKLHTTQPNISTRIANLEARLRVQLMRRNAGSVRLTPMGVRLLPHARAVIAAQDALLDAAGDDSLFVGVLRLGVTELVALTWLRAFMRAMKARFDNITVELTVDLSASLTEALEQQSLDLALQSGPFTDATLESVPLTSHPWVWVARPDMDIAAGPIGAKDLRGHAVLTHTRGTEPFRQLEAHFRAESAVRLVPSSNIAACLQMTLDGLGLSCLPAPMVAEPLSKGSLRRLDYPWLPHPLDFAARFNAQSSPSYVAKAANLAAEVAT